MRPPASVVQWSGERWSDTGWILQEEPREFPGRYNILGMRERGVKDDPKAFGLSKW